MAGIDRTSDRRLTIGLAGAVALGLAAMALTPSIQHVTPHAAAFAGLPRLGLYALAGVLLGVTGSVLAPWRWPAPEPGVPGGWLRPKNRWLAGWLAGASLVAVLNAARLRGDLADPLGPWLWIASMLLVLVAVAPSLRPSHPWRPPLTPAVWLVWALLAGIVLVAAIVRFTDLDSVPMTVQADEGDRAASALNILDGVAPPSWFDSGWYYINMVYFRLLAATFALLGVGVAQGRALSAVSGMVFIGAVAWIGCRQFSWRVGLVATALAATGAFILQFSRTIMESGIAATLWAVSVAGLLEGARTRRAWPYALAGLCGGLSLYTYPSARLWVLGAGLTLGVIWLFARGQRQAIVQGAIIVAVAGAIAGLPFLAHLERRPNEATLRYEQTTVLSAVNQTRLRYTRPEMPLPELLTIQVERSLGMFDRYRDESGFLPTNQPLYPILLAALTLLGIFFALARAVRDVRLAVLSVWFWLGLSGVILTVETPAAQRAAGLLVTLPLLGAVALVELVGRAPIAARVFRPVESVPASQQAATTGRWNRVTGTCLALVVVIATVWQTIFYFDVYGRMAEPWAHPTREGRQVAALGSVGPVYSLEVAEHRVNAGWIRFLARGTRTGSIANPNQELPILTTDGPPANEAQRRFPFPVPTADEGMSFLLHGQELQPYLSLLTALYAGGSVLPSVDERVTYQVPAVAVQGSRGVTLRRPDGTQTRVATFGEIPAGLTLPGRLEWSGGVRVARTAPYRFELVAPGPARLLIDDVALPGSADGALTRGDVMLARGLHHLRLVVDVRTPDDIIQLRRARLPIRGVPASEPRAFSPEETFAAMDAPWGLLGTATPAGAAPASEVKTFLDSTLAAAFMRQDEPLPAAGRIVWRGSLLAPRAGVYRMAFATDAPLAIQIDGRPIDVQQVKAETWKELSFGTPVELAAGPHAIEISMPIVGSGRTLLRWVWVPPAGDGRADADGAWAVVPPMQLRPAAPVWPVGQEPASR